MSRRCAPEAGHRRRRHVLEWRSSFGTPPGEEAALAARSSGEQVYEAGFDAVRPQLGLGRAHAARAVPRRASAASSSAPIECNGMVLDRFGGPEVLKWQRLSAPVPGTRRGCACATRPSA